MAQHRHPSNFTVATCDGGCMVCCDCRRGLHVDISGILPVIDTVYTRSLNGVETDFTFKTISYGVDTAGPYFLGTVVDGEGKPFRECCQRVIATAQVDIGEEENIGYALVLGMNSYPGGSEVYLAAWRYFGPGTIIFHFNRTGAHHLCNLPKGEYTNLENIQAAQYVTNVGYLTEFDEDVLPVKPVFGNSDGGYLHQGLAPVSRSTDAYDCACSDCYGPAAYTITVSNLLSLCIGVIQPDVDSVDLELLAEYTCAPQTGYEPGTLSEEHVGTPVECDENPFDVCFGEYNSTWTVQASVLISHEGYPEYDGNNTRIFVFVTLNCDGPIPSTWLAAHGVFYTMSKCAGGIEPTTVTGVELYEGNILIGTVDVEIAPA